MNASDATHWHAIVATAPSPGAVAIVQLHGPNMSDLLHRLTGRRHWPPGRVFLVDIASIDRGLAMRWGPSAEEGQGAEAGGELHLHGGLFVVRRVVEHLASLGVRIVSADQIPSRQQYPEASSDLEADMLACLATAWSPAAIGLLLAQPRLWTQAIVRSPEAAEGGNIPNIQADSIRWDRLRVPPTVALVGQTNIGKSTLTNRLLAREASLVADHPGTTRDWVGGLAMLGDVAIRWIDTPGLMADQSDIDRIAIALAMSQTRQAELLIAMRDPMSDWPDESALGRSPDLWVMNKSDALSPSQRPMTGSGASANSPITISAKTGDGVWRLSEAILDRLGLADLTPTLWAFSPALKRLVARNDFPGLRAYAEQRMV